MSDPEIPAWPVTILRARYGGVYEPGAWIAFPLTPGEVPQEWDADDVTCMTFFDERRGQVGGGATPDKALAHLISLMPPSVNGE
jgi:hypothetical protein